VTQQRTARGLENVRKKFQKQDRLMARVTMDKMEFDEERLSKAVGVAPKWKVPNDYAAARSAANAGTPLVLEKSAIAEVLHQMARAASGKPPGGEKKKRFSLFG